VKEENAAMNRFIISSLVVLAASSAAAQTIESTFTDFDLKKCQHILGTVEEDYGAWRCKGYDGIAIWMSAGDQRVMISFGPRAKEEPAAHQTLASFNGEGEKIEWRIEKGENKKQPFAAIMRWSTTTLDDKGEQVRGEVLVVTRLPPGAVCHVGYVDGRANQNADELAREIADKRAREFRCCKDAPIVLGTTGPGFSDPLDLNGN
jgi:hypothetical protein